MDNMKTKELRIPTIPRCTPVEESKLDIKAFEVKGDSMDDNTHESFLTGDIVMVIECKDFTNIDFKSHPYWIVEVKDGIHLRQITAVENGMVTFHSLNPLSLDVTISINVIKKLYYVYESRRKASQLCNLKY